MEEKYKHKIITIPNVLSFFRLLLIPVIVWLYIVKKDPIWTMAVLAMFILIAAYVISPADAIPGPLDDLVIMLLGMAANKKLNKNSQAAQSMEGKTVVESYGEYVD